jgi:hypothetical protein
MAASCGGQVAELSRTLSEERYFGGADALQHFAARGLKAAISAAAAASHLQALAGTERPSRQLATLLQFLDTHDRLPAADDPLRERHLRARSAVLSAIHGLRLAHEQLDESPRPLSDLAAMLRRWIEGQTFAPRQDDRRPAADAQAARAVNSTRCSWLVSSKEVRSAPKASSIRLAAQPARLAGFPGCHRGRARRVRRSACCRAVSCISTFELESD